MNSIIFILSVRIHLVVPNCADPKSCFPSVRTSLGRPMVTMMGSTAGMSLPQLHSYLLNAGFLVIPGPTVEETTSRCADGPATAPVERSEPSDDEAITARITTIRTIIAGTIAAAAAPTSTGTAGLSGLTATNTTTSRHQGNCSHLYTRWGCRPSSRRDHR